MEKVRWQYTGILIGLFLLVLYSIGRFAFSSPPPAHRAGEVVEFRKDGFVIEVTLNHDQYECVRGYWMKCFSRGSVKVFVPGKILSDARVVTSPGQFLSYYSLEIMSKEGISEKKVSFWGARGDIIFPWVIPEGEIAWVGQENFSERQGDEKAQEASTR